MLYPKYYHFNVMYQNETTLMLYPNETPLLLYPNETPLM